MSKSFLFIIPLSPDENITPLRKALQDACLNCLISQNYKNWSALLIGKVNPKTLPEHFIFINKEGTKTEKLHTAVEYIKSENLKPDYTIRLDDDDLFNPTILATLGEENFDVYTDKYHSFITADGNYLAQQVRFWFPNTCIIKTSHALTHFGNYPKNNKVQFKTPSTLIENEHTYFSKYFSSKDIIALAAKKNPVYVRVLNPDSITYTSFGSQSNYFKQFGKWKKNNLNVFNKIISALKPVTPGLNHHMYLKTSFKETLIAAKINFIGSLKFRKKTLGNKSSNRTNSDINYLQLHK